MAPLNGLRPLWRELREPQHRLRKAGAELLKDGSIAKNPQQLGPLALEARLMGLECDHAAGNYRILMTLAGEMLTAAARQDLGVLDEKLYLDVFAQPGTKPQRRAAAR